MASCANCGSPLAEGQQFCGTCGQPVGQAGAAATIPPPPPPPPLPETTPPPLPGEAYGPGPAYVQGGWTSPPPRRGRKWLWIGLAAVVVVAAIACVLVFVVFDGEAAATPEDAVENLISALEDKDVDAFFSLMDPEAVDAMLAILGVESLDEAKDVIEGQMFDYESVEFSGVKLETEQTSDTTATVTMTAGKVTWTDSDGQETTSDVEESDEPAVFKLTKRDGSWYLMESTFALGEGGSTTTTTEVPGTTTTVDVTTTTEGPSTTEATTSTTGGPPTTSGGATATTPEDAVLRMFAAMEDKDMDALFALMDPVAIEEELPDLSLEEAKEHLSLDAFPYQSVEFTGIKLSTEETSATTAIVTIVEGVVTVTDEDGEPEVEDVKDTDEPVTFNVIERGGSWYLDPSEMF